MAKKVSLQDIQKINEIYYVCHNYAEVARQTGWSPATVKRYVDKNYIPVDENNIIRFDPTVDLPKEFDTEIFKNVDNYGELCTLLPQEKIEIEALWKELSV